MPTGSAYLDVLKRLHVDVLRLAQLASQLLPLLLQPEDVLPLPRYLELGVEYVGRPISLEEDQYFAGFESNISLVYPSGPLPLLYRALFCTTYLSCRTSRARMKGACSTTALV